MTGRSPSLQHEIFRSTRGHAQALYDGVATMSGPTPHAVRQFPISDGIPPNPALNLFQKKRELIDPCFPGRGDFAAARRTSREISDDAPMRMGTYPHSPVPGLT